MKGGIAFVLGLFLINFVSAQFFDGYNNFSITGLFDNINSQDLILLTLFILFFTFLFVVLSRISLFKDAYGQPNKGILVVISFAISLLAVYGIYKSNFDLEGLFSGFGISSDIFYPLIWIVLIAAAVLIIWKLKFGGFFTIFGLLISVVTFSTNFFYEKGVAAIIGIVMFLIGLWLWKRSNRYMRYMAGSAGRSIRSNYSGVGLWQNKKILFLGIMVAVLGFFIKINTVIIVGIAIAILGAILWFLFRPRYPISPGTGRGSRALNWRPPVTPPPPGLRILRSGEY